MCSAPTNSGFFRVFYCPYTDYNDYLQGIFAMSVTTTLDAARACRYRYFTWRSDLSWFKRLTMAVAMACVTGLAAQVRVPLPFTAVPVTGQVFAVLLSGVLLGTYFGGLSQMFYVGLGAVGMPWFAGANPTTLGYIVGFIPAAILVGWMTDRHAKFRGLPGQALLMTGAVAIIYGLGALYYGFVMGLGPIATLMQAVVPFIPADAVKIALAAGISTTMLPKKPYGPEATHQ